MKKITCVLLSAIMLCACFVVNGSAADIVYGDIDGNGSVTVADARLILRYAVNLESFSETQMQAADVNRDDAVSISDARAVLRGAVKLDDPKYFGLDGSEIFKGGHYTMTAVMSGTDGISMVRAQTETTAYLEATLVFDASDFNTEEDGDDTEEQSDPVRIGFLTTQDAVYWVLPDISCYLCIDDKVSGEMGIDASFFQEILPPGISGDSDYDDPSRIKKVTIDGIEMTRKIFENDDGTSVAHDLNKSQLVYVRSFDADGNEIAVMEVASISANIPAYQCGLPSGSTLYNGDSLFAFMLRFAQLAKIDITP